MRKKSGKRKHDDNKLLAAEVKRLRAHLKKSEAVAAKWKARAKKLEADAVRTAKELRRLEKLRKREATTPDEHIDAVDATAVESPVSTDGPDESWTVTRLRTSAREAGVPGYSRMTKAALLDALAPSPRE